MLLVALVGAAIWTFMFDAIGEIDRKRKERGQ